MEASPVSAAPYRAPSHAPPVTFVAPPSPPPRAHLLATLALTVAAGLSAGASVHLTRALTAMRPSPPPRERTVSPRRPPSLREAAEDLARRHRGALFVAPDVPFGAERAPVTDALDGSPRDAVRALDAWAATRGLWFHDAGGVLRLERAVTAVDLDCDDTLDACATRLERVASVVVQREGESADARVHLRLTRDIPALDGAREALVAAGFAVDTVGRTLWVSPPATSAPRAVHAASRVVRRSDIARWLVAPPSALRGARIVPVARGQRIVGVRVLGVRQGDALAGLGIAEGDVIQRVNGLDIASPDRCLEAYARLRQQDEVVVDIVRRGRRLTLRYVMV